MNTESTLPAAKPAASVRRARAPKRKTRITIYLDDQVLSEFRNLSELRYRLPDPDQRGVEPPSGGSRRRKQPGLTFLSSSLWVGLHRAILLC